MKVGINAASLHRVRKDDAMMTVIAIAIVSI